MMKRRDNVTVRSFHHRCSASARLCQVFPYPKQPCRTLLLSTLISPLWVDGLVIDRALSVGGQTSMKRCLIAARTEVYQWWLFKRLITSFRPDIELSVLILGLFSRYSSLQYPHSQCKCLLCFCPLQSCCVTVMITNLFRKSPLRSSLELRFKRFESQQLFRLPIVD